MKKLTSISFVFIAIFMLIIAGCSNNTNTEEKGKFNAGTYEGVSTGHGGEIKATVVVSKDKIEKIEISADKETGSISDGATTQLTNDIISSQSLAVDVVSGASESSNGIIEAVTKALEKSGADIEALKDAANKVIVEEQQQEDLDVDIAIIGAGGAGLSAALKASEAGKSVVILEQMPIIGGNTNRATGGMNVAGTKYQEADGIKDDKQTWYDDTMKGGKNLNDPQLLKTLVDNAPDALEWLNDMGAGLTKVTLSGGQTNPRIHQPEDGSPVGPVIVEVLSNKLKELNIPILLNTTADSLIEKDGTIVGVKATDKNMNPFTINSKSVILATGGFGANAEMVIEYNENLEGFSTTNHAGATGSGITMAEEVGADLVDIDQIQIHPTTDPETGYLFTEGLRGDGAILVNKEGKRFTNELLTRDIVSKNILAQTDKIAYLVVNQEMADENASLSGYIEDGYATKGETIEALGSEIGIDSSTLATTLKNYTKYVNNNNDEEFDRTHLTQTLAEGPYYTIPVTPGIHHTMGGLKIDTQTHVLDKKGNKIKGLYAAGEVTGGIHGGNRIGGNAVADIIVFGRIAGETSANEID
ncbi:MULTISPECIES: flavocytochrome c [Bacillaceae]|uniref:Urocanate reductase n=1 Tax=Niallia hominis TaxID=3133173 RepID=A0ABV1F2M5_9BACI|nr:MULTISPECIES: flavocytochrome c [Bacillaceae]MCM3361048.1 flavocytochrome c [Niallia sp. MER TA 168]